MALVAQTNLMMLREMNRSTSRCSSRAGAMSDAYQSYDVWEEHELIECARAGSVRAFNELILRYQTRIYNIAYRILGDEDSAADVTQDTFLAAYRALATFSGSSFAAWLTRIAKNRCYDEFRRRQRRPLTTLDALYTTDIRLDDPFGSSRFESPEASVQRSELQQILHDGLQDLPEDQRLVVVLADLEGYEYAEIAEIVGVPIGTVKSRLSRGRQRMQDYLGQTMYAPGVQSM